MPTQLETPTSDAEATGLLTETDTPVESPAFDGIDAAEVIRHFAPAPADDAPSRYGIDHPVLRVPVNDRIPVETPPCPVCEATSATPKFMLTESRFRLVECHDCGLGSLHPRPEAEEIAEFYPSSYYGAAGAKFRGGIERAIRWVAGRRARWLSRGLPKNGRVLDVGCGRGTILNQMAEAGFESHGFELSRDAAEGLHPAVQLTVGSDLTTAEYPDDHFDLITAWHVLEHVSDPRSTLAEMQRILKPGGRIAIAVPNFGSLQAKLFGAAWFHLDLPRHLFHLSADNLRQLFRKCALEVEYERHFSLRQNPFGWVQSVLNARWPQERNALYSDLKRGGVSVLTGFRKFAMRAAYWLGMPVSVGLSILAAALRSGGTVCLTGRKR